MLLTVNILIESTTLKASVALATTEAAELSSLGDANIETESTTPKDIVKSATLSTKDSESKEPSKCKTLLIDIAQLILSTILGYIFGWAMEKAKVHEPVAIRQQMIFQKFINEIS